MTRLRFPELMSLFLGRSRVIPTVPVCLWVSAVPGRTGQLFHSVARIPPLLLFPSLWTLNLGRIRSYEANRCAGAHQQPPWLTSWALGER